MAQGNLSDLEYYEKIERRFPFKFPTTMKYAFTLSFFTGMIHGVAAKKPIILFKHVGLLVPTLSAWIFKEDIEVYYKFRHLKQNNAASVPTENSNNNQSQNNQ